ncbi:hypothetical protein [Pandoraea pnomenusa]|uniref:hypothetical protein n=1 Tax=Pandoraea pnomenusa TaxID=93220 RepID=UPI0033421E2B
MTRSAPLAPSASIASIVSAGAPAIRRIGGTLGVLSLTLAAGCAQLQLPPPDAPVARLPEAPPSAAAPAMTEAQAQDLTRLNKRIFEEQESTIEQERAQRALDAAMRNYYNSNAYFYGGWGGPGWYGPGWYGPGWYGPRSSVGVSVGF